MTVVDDSTTVSSPVLRKISGFHGGAYGPDIPVRFWISSAHAALNIYPFTLVEFLSASV
jgi:hypothetical protein